MQYKVDDIVTIRSDHGLARCDAYCQWSSECQAQWAGKTVIISRIDKNGYGNHYHAITSSIEYSFHISECMILGYSKVKGVRFITKKINKDFAIPERTTPLKIPYKQFKIGIELETLVPQDSIETIQTAITTNKIAFVTTGDGSITSDGDARGVEFKSAHAMTYTDLKVDLKRLIGEFQKHEVYVNTSCGFHLHVSNKRFFTASNMSRIIMAWSAIEDVLLATQPKSRTNNSYCQRYLKQFIKDEKNDFKLLRGKEKLSTQLASSSRERYFTLNLKALKKHGTIEIRLHAGTTNYTKVMAWVDLMLAFFTYCLTDYKHKEVFGLFYQPISELKVTNTLNALGMSDKRKIYFKNRVNKFLFSYLAKQQESAGKIMQNIKAVKKARQQYLASEKKYSGLNTAFEQEYRTLQQTS